MLLLYLFKQNSISKASLSLWTINTNNNNNEAKEESTLWEDEAQWSLI